MAAFHAAQEELAQAGVGLVAVSTDGRQAAEALVDELGLGFPVGHSLPLEATAKALGAFYEPRRGILHATALLYDPDGRVLLSVYSSGAVGRLRPDELLGLVRFWDRDRPAS